jgi:hypothetical protein
MYHRFDQFSHAMNIRLLFPITYLEEVKTSGEFLRFKMKMVSDV